MKTFKNDSGVYVVRIQTEHGRRTISTGSKNLSEARKMIRQAKVRQLELTAKTVRLTRDVVAQIVTGRKVKVREAIEEFKQWMEEGYKTKRTGLNNWMAVRAWAREMNLEEVPVGAVTEKEIGRWINNPLSKKKASWRNVQLSCVRLFFEFCSIRNYCLGNPAKLVKLDFQKMSHEQKERREARIYTDEEVDRIMAYTGERKLEEERKIPELERALAELPDKNRSVRLGAAQARVQRDKLEALLQKAQQWRRHWQFWKFAVVFGRWTGLRLGDICQMEWSCFKPGKAIVWTDKRDRRVELEMEPKMKEVFEELRKETSNIERSTSNIELSKYLFPERREQALDRKKRAGLSVEFSRLSKMAGVTGHVFHDLRSSYCSAQDRAGVPIEHIRRAAGHARAETTRGYIKGE